MMRRVKVCTALGLSLAALMCAAVNPADAISLELAQKCRALALKAHPYKQPGEPGPGSAAAERGYYNECVTKGGNMPNEKPNGGQAGSSQSPISPPAKQ
jgi:hypothetical protein